jgi:cation transport ATPase
VRASRERDRLLVVAKLRAFEDGEATFGQLVWRLRRTGLMGDGDELRRRASQAVRGLDASGVVLVTGDHGEEPSVLLLQWPPGDDDEAAA